jgi:hypothetical protein
MFPTTPKALQRLIETQLAVGEVIVTRTGGMWLDPFSAKTQNEMIRMVAEKQAAAAEAAMTFGMALARESMAFWMIAPFQPLKAFPAEAAVKRALRQAEAPVTRRIMANRRRLRR